MNTFKSTLLALLLSGVQLIATANGNAIKVEQQERDHILSLATLAMVYKDWQSSPDGRGHNIGSILVDENSTPVFWARNSVTVRGNATQHGEVRLIQAFLDCPGIGKYVDGYSIYTSLEPCAMCTGMMAMTKLKRAVFVQADPEYGHARKALLSIKFPRIFDQATPHQLSQKEALENGWIRYRAANKGQTITDFLLSDEAHGIYASAQVELAQFKVKYPVNQTLLQSTEKFLDSVTTETFGQQMLERCPIPSDQ
jgi:tRNA(Arg) A34 adenosine deaminase TadA